MRAISMVPSWTETLINCGVEVVGRTRYCVHPQEEIRNIPVVGGTKDINWEKVAALKADILILDQEENPKVMAEKSPLPFFASHIQKVSDLERDLNSMAKLFNNSKFSDLALRWKKINEAPSHKINWALAPGIVEWIKPCSGQEKSLLYLIWHKPWMTVSKNTFIGSVLEIVFGGVALMEFDTPYPEVDLSKYDPRKTLLLFSTEPYPFEKKKQLIAELLKDLPFSAAIIDGEAYSWFGLRTLEFLEKHLFKG